MPGVDLFPGGGLIKIPDHELLRLIGRGSYGEVWLAQNIMGTFRAVKIIRRSNFDTGAPFQRELDGIKKFEPISRTHDGFVDVLQIGRNEEQECLYYVMEAADDLEFGQAIDPQKYIPKTLGKALSQAKRFPVEQCVQMGMALCQALEHLHRHGLVHRDIKPSNIVFIHDAPKLADIGLVTDSNNAHSFVGTEGFIPPEGPGGKQADIYSLGKALYEIASGRDRLDFPALPPGLAEFPDGERFLELNEALIRACRQNPKDRYASAREMYEDLALLASGKSLRRLRMLEARWEQTKRIAVAVASAVALTAVIAFPLVRERQHAEELRERQIGERSATGIHKMDSGDLAGSLSEFSEIFQLEAKKKDHYLANQTRVASILANTPRLTQMLFLENRVSSVDFSRDHKQLLTVEKANHAQVHDLATSRRNSGPFGSTSPGQASFSPDNRSIIIANEDGWASIWDLKTTNETRLPHPANVMCAKFSPSGKRIATACKDGIARVWNAATREIIYEFQGHTGTIRSVAFSPNEKLLVSTSVDLTARIWDLETGKQIGSELRHPGWVSDAAFSPDSSRLVTACHDGWARLWDVRTRELLPSLMKHDDVIAQVAFSPDGLTILTASADSTLRLWDAATTMPLRRNHVLRHSSGVLAACFSSDGHQIATGSADGVVRVWEFAEIDTDPTLVSGNINASGRTMAIITNNSIHVSSLNNPRSETNSFQVDGDVRELALSDKDGMVGAVTGNAKNSKERLHIWKLRADDSELTMEVTLGEKASRLSFSPNGALFTLKDGPAVRVFETAQNVELPLNANLQNNGVVAFHPSKKRFAIGAGPKVGLYEGVETRPVFPEIEVDGNVQHLAFSPDGKLLLVSQSDNSINPRSAILIDADTGKTVGPEIWHRDGVLQGAFRPDGRRAITGGEDRQALIWDVGSSHSVLARLLHPHQVLSVAFSEDGRWIGTTCGNRTVRIWDAETYIPITPPLDCERNQSQIIFLPGAPRFATIQNSTRFWLWTLQRIDITPNDAIALSSLLNSEPTATGQPQTKPIAETWSRLSRAFPERFAASKEEISRWHALKYETAKKANQAEVASFHLRALRAAESENESGDSGPGIEKTALVKPE